MIEPLVVSASHLWVRFKAQGARIEASVARKAEEQEFMDYDPEDEKMLGKWLVWLGGL